MIRWKFRVWDIREKKLYYPQSVVVYCYEDCRIHMTLPDAEISIPEGYFELEMSLDIRDVDSMLIYDGDILQSPDSLKKYIVKYLTKEAKFVAESVDSTKWLPLDIERWKVIGNRHEHMDLLK
jgi:YopX protein